jgi:hypothetical protein
MLSEALVILSSAELTKSDIRADHLCQTQKYNLGNRSEVPGSGFRGYKVAKNPRMKLRLAGTVNHVKDVI